MFQIDPKTLIFFSSVLSGLMTLILLTPKDGAGKQVPGMSSWAAGSAAYSAGCICYSFRGAWPDLIAIVLGNICYLLAMSCWLCGTLIFHQKKPPVKFIFMLCCATAFVIAWFTVIQSNYQVRLIVFTLLAGSMYAIQAFVAVRYGEKNLVYLFFIAAFVIASATMFFRMIGAFFSLGSGTDFLSKDWVQVTYLIFASSAPLVLCTGFFMLASTRIQNQLSELSRTDALTGILNRRAFLEKCEREFLRYSKGNTSVSMIMIDIDHFKRVNDTYGHATGDHVITSVCHAVQKMLRKSDGFGRLGGEEFAILLPGTSLENAHILAERIRQHVELTKMTEELHVTLSLGVTRFMAHSELLQDVMHRADAALYQAKAMGRNRTVLSQ
jgi:diguanylate cyclase (GGDEF)-like protein